MTTDSELVPAGDHSGGKQAATQWDWRNVGGRNFITPAQDQGACQASTAFAITGAMNAKLRIRSSIAVGEAKEVLVPDLSAADLFYCGGGDCSAGQDVKPAFDYVTDKGVVPAYNIPYKPAGQTCGRGPADLEARVTAISGVIKQRSRGSIQDAIQSRGPIIATLRAYQDLKNYKSGVYRYDGTSPFLYTLTVSVIGFTADGWLCKNSWGPSWGVGGVFTLAYGECGIDDEWMWEIAGFTKTYPYGSVAGTAAPYYDGPSGPLRVLYRDVAGTTWDLTGYPPSATQPIPLDGPPAGEDPSFSPQGQSHRNAVRPDTLGYIQFNTWNSGWSKMQALTGPQGLTDGPAAVGKLGTSGPYVLYRDADGNIHAVFVYSQKWTWQQVTGGAGLKAPPAAGDPQLQQFGSTLHVFYRDNDGNIQDLQNAGGKWSVTQITDGGLTTAPKTIGEPRPWVADGYLQIFYRDKYGIIRQILYDGSKWGWDTIPIEIVANSDPALTTYAGGIRFFYRESRGTIWHVYWYNQRWNPEVLTGVGSISGGEYAEGDPAVISFGNEIHVLYRDINDNLSDAYWTGTTWTHLVRI